MLILFVQYCHDVGPVKSITRITIKYRPSLFKKLS